MNINRQNYEIYFIDYIDGTLTSKEVKELYKFLLLNDDLRELLECQSEVKLQAPNIVYEKKTMLKKDKLHECTDYYAIAITEHSLTTHDKEFIRKYPVSKEDIAIYQKIKLKCDARIHYPNKAQLYHRSKIYLTTLQRYISAAILILLVGINYLLYSQQAERIELPIAQTILIPYNQGIESKQIAISLTIKKYATPLNTPLPEERIELSLMELNYSTIVRLSSVNPHHSLISQDGIIMSVKPPEMYLTEAAHTWKEDRAHLLSDNIISSMRDTGKAITQRLKIKYFLNNNRDDYASY